MGLFDKFRKPSRPEALDVSAPAGTVLAPVAGDVITLENVPDPVFSSGVMGRGCGIEPTGEVVYAPVAGMLSAIGAPNYHAVGIIGDDGAEILIHVGVDTVEMRGDGFTVFGEKGAHVHAGEPLLSFSKKKIEAAGHASTVIIALTNTDDLAAVELVKTGNIGAGEKVISFQG
jgi:PTS system, glucose subfamily, IIA component